MGGTPGALQHTLRADLVTGQAALPQGTTPGDAELRNVGA
jgi:hypothetical protein